MSEVDTLLDIAFNAYNEERFDEAEAMARKVLTIIPAHGDALYLLGLIAFQAGALEPAAELLYQGVKLYPDMENYALTLASVLHKQGRLDEALSFYEKYKDNPLALSQIGLIFATKGQDDWARSSFEAALKKNPDLVEAVVGLAIIARRQGEFKEAKRLLLGAQKQTPSVDVFYQLSLLYRLEGDFAQAQSAIGQALKIQKTPALLNEYGLVLEGLGKEEEALAAYHESTEMNPYFADGYFNAGNVYQKQDKLKHAEDSYKRALVQDKSFLQAHHNLASLLYKQGRLGESLNYFQEAVILNPRYMPAVYNLGVLMEEQGDFSEAAGLYFNALSLGMTDAILPFRIHATLLELAVQNTAGKKQAIQFAKGWVKNFPQDVVARHTLSILSGRKSEVAESYAAQFYDVFAASYDEKMGQLESVALRETIKVLPQKMYKKVLDLACGTGSFAKYFNQNFKSISGVDISQKMLDKAREVGMYQTLVKESAVSFLSHIKQVFDLIVAVELVCYLTDVTDLFAQVQGHLTKDGLFVFTVEQAPEKTDKMLSLTGRYVYGKSYIEGQLKAVRLQALTIKEIDLRRQKDGYAKGFVILAKRL